MEGLLEWALTSTGLILSCRVEIPWGEALLASVDQVGSGFKDFFLLDCDCVGVRGDDGLFTGAEILGMVLVGGVLDLLFLF